MEKLYYDRENKKFYVKELNIENNIVTDEQYVDVTDEIVTLVQEHVTKDGKKVICLDTTSTIEQEQSLKSLSPQPKQEWNDEDEKLLNKVEALLNDYCDFLEDESSRFIPEVRETISRLKSLRHSWKPSEGQMNGLAHAINLDVYDAKRYGLDSLYNDLKKL